LAGLTVPYLIFANNSHCLSLKERKNFILVALSVMLGSGIQGLADL